MKYSGWAAFAYSASVFKDMSEALAWLERKMRIEGIVPPPGDIRQYLNHTPCIPGFNCRVELDRMESALEELVRTAEDTIELGRRIIEDARRHGVTEFELRLSGPVGPAPDRPQAGETTRRPRRKRPSPRKPLPERRAR